MEETLKLFLKSRDTSDGIIEVMEEQKIGIDTIKLMDQDTLQRFIPKVGDRLAVIDFCNRTHPYKRKDSLLEKLRDKLKRKGGFETEKDEISKSERSTKTNRMIEIGWLHFEKGRYVQVRAKQGGGTRKVSVKQHSTKKDIISVAKSLFFVDGVSTKGHASEFDFDLSDFKCQDITEDITVRKVFETTGITRLRFYITTRYKNKPSTTVSSNAQEEHHINGENIIESATSQPVIIDDCYLSQETTQSVEESIISTAIKRSKINLPSFLVSSDEENEENGSQGDNEEVVYSIGTTADSDFDLEKVTFQSDPNFEQIFEEPVNQNSINNSIIILHRGHVLEEMIEQFLNIGVNSKLELEIYLPNGEKEIAQNFGGVFRDILSEFWQDFFNRYTAGANAKVPVIRHDFDENKWSSVAKILIKGWSEEKYYPVQFSRTFMEKCIFGKTYSDLVKDLLRYIPEMDSRMIKNALENFEDIDTEELLECLDSLECKWKPTKENFERLISDLAHKELIQKPMFIIDCWSNILCQMMTNDDMNRIYNDNENLPRNILKNLVFDEPLESDNQTVASYLKKFIREGDMRTLCNFLRFVTGSNILIGELPIKVSFSPEENRNIRTPTAHTCSSMLVLPTSYESYPDFRHEFTSVLNSNVWVMDII